MCFLTTLSPSNTLVIIGEHNRTKPRTLSLSSQIPCGLAWDRDRASAVKGRWTKYFVIRDDRQGPETRYC